MAAAFAAAQTALGSLRSLEPGAKTQTKRSLGTSRLEQCAPNLNFNGMPGSTNTHPDSIWTFAGRGTRLIALGLQFAVLIPASAWVTGRAAHIAKR